MSEKGENAKLNVVIERDVRVCGHKEDGKWEEPRITSSAD